MPAWGAPGGGPLTDQQIDEHHRLPLAASSSRRRVARTRCRQEIDAVCKPDEADGNCTRHGDDRPASTGRRSARPCSTWATTTASPAAPTRAAAATPRAGPTASREVAGGGGASGPNLTGGSELRQFETADQQQVDFVVASARSRASPTATAASGSGQMPGFGINPNRGATPTSAPGHRHGRRPRSCTPRTRSRAVVAYERSL